jgi:hypothetical protein
MANIIDTSFFVGDIEIANVNQEEIAADLNQSIKTYEREVLIQLLGYTLYKELAAATPVTGDKWDKLINGEDFSYTLNGRTVETNWPGLKGYEKKSPIAYYVYFMHRRKRSSYNAGVGQEVEPKTDNSIKGNLYAKLVFIWNEFIAMYGGECVDKDSLVAHYSYDENYVNCAYNYLLAKKADFTTWKFLNLGGKINIFGI